MKQITEDYCSFETAKLLKEKGFDWQQSPFYSEQYMDEWKQENSYQIPNPDYDPNIPFDTETITMVAPHISQSIALKWLREVHKLIVLVEYDTFTDEFYCYIRKKFSDYIIPTESYNSYEQAVEAAILYILKNLI